MAPVALGDKIPAVKLAYMDSTNTKHVFDTCADKKHVPDFIQRADDLQAKGVDGIYCVSVNDVFVMKAWEATFPIDGKLQMLADGNGDFAEALGIQLDLKEFGLGLRSKRFALVTVDGVVKILNVEEGGEYTKSGPETILKAIEGGALEA
ncbi:hypothetical protein CBR_g61495 [Chara braunii]|uniref:Glutaredoxin-dependent peroxiredoxin n=1 Tax=Chara braunii TaxID=69332 RepID=A0A388K8R4_CHABU|nr:hypothetical protein CBR_g61495 [Chara braunii]|eukprot:GBG66452.1 hypothetical protein CBR_g61495 [Chara braunii]